VDGNTGLPAGYQARWVAKGYSRLESIHFAELYAGVAYKDSICVFSATVIHFDLECGQVDIVAAFLNGAKTTSSLSILDGCEPIPPHKRSTSDRR
jgi:hypothetical protein